MATASLAAPAPPRPYRRFLTSTLHKRFVHAALISLLLAFNNAFWLGSKRDLFWSWFPFGPAGIKALLFWMSSLFIFILQIATLKIGRRTIASPFATLRANLFGGTAIQTGFWYTVSAWWFTEAYVWSAPDLGWITRGSHSTPDMLNERPIFFRLYTLLLALSYAAYHLYDGKSALIIPVSRASTAPAAQHQPQSTHRLDPIQARLKQSLSFALIRSGVAALFILFAAVVLNWLWLRDLFWQLHLILAKMFFNLSRANAQPTGIPPLGPDFLAHSLVAGFLLVLTWELTSLLFLTYLNQPPVKAGLPLSSSSKDPNGTLLNGLKAKRDVVKTFAFWELAIIAQRHKERRKAIFEDIERPGGPLWSQMSAAGLSVLREVDIRISGPPPQISQPTSNGSIKTLPHIVPELPTQPIFQPSPKTRKVEALVSGQLRQIGSSAKPWHPPVEKTTKELETKLLEYVKPPGADKAPSQGVLEQWAAVLRSSPVGWFFVSTKAAKINATVLGSPYGNAALIVDAIDSITRMLVASLTEDTFGKATPTVPEAVRTFTRTLLVIEDFLAKNNPGDRSGIEEVDIIIKRLRSGLKELLSAFQLYLIDVGLGISELNQAKKAVEAPQPEEVQEQQRAPPPTRRQLFSNKQPTANASERRTVSSTQESRGKLEAPQRSHEGTTRSATGANIRPSRREMEEVR
ncbi:Nucleoporin NDC1 [Exophiala dermatitidis]